MNTANATQPSRIEELARDPQWHALLQLHNGRPQIGDAGFYADGPFKSAAQELTSLIRVLGDSPLSQCKFAARATWLSRALDLPAPDFSRCNDLMEFLVKAPADKISVVFASENITQATTMMGHIFLKLSGLTPKGLKTEHAISFYTGTEDWNFLKLFVQAGVTGKEGFYALAPYENIKNDYIFLQQRNLWEYDLALSDFSRRLVRLHLYELRRIRFTYRFVSFNCATLIQNIAAVGSPEIGKLRGFWITPLDVVRAINSENSAFISGTTVLPSTKWKIRALQDTLRPDRSVKSVIKKRDYLKLNELVRASELSRERQFLMFDLASAYNSFELESSDIDVEDWKRNDDFISKVRSDVFANGVAEASNYKKPSLIPLDSQLTLRFSKRRADDFLSLEFLPASHELGDENNQYTGESELKIFSPEAEVDLKRGTFRLGSFVLYSAVSFQPADLLISSVSSKLRFGYETAASRTLEHRRGTFLEGALGKTYRLSRDFDWYTLLGGGYREALADGYAGLETGFILREIYGLKTIATYAPILPIRNGSVALHNFKLSQSLNRAQYALGIELEIDRTRSTSKRNTQVILRRLF